MNAVEKIRSNPQDYIGADLAVPDAVALELIALSVCEHTHHIHAERPPVQIQLAISGALMGTIQDTGRGMRLEPDPGDEMSHAERACTSIYPIEAADASVQAALGELVWGPAGSQGPVVANALCSAFVFQSRRDGEVWEQCYRRGVPEGPACLVGATQRSGTTIRFLVDSRFASKRSLDPEFLQERIAQLGARVPGLSIQLRT